MFGFLLQVMKKGRANIKLMKFSLVKWSTQKSVVGLIGCIDSYLVYDNIYFYY